VSAVGVTNPWTKGENKVSMPSTRRLFKTINNLDGVMKMLRTDMINKPRRLTHIDMFSQDSTDIKAICTSNWRSDNPQVTTSEIKRPILVGLTKDD
jgi:hypothetical protein